MGLDRTCILPCRCRSCLSSSPCSGTRLPLETGTQPEGISQRPPLVTPPRAEGQASPRCAQSTALRSSNGRVSRAMGRRTSPRGRVAAVEVVWWLERGPSPSTAVTPLDLCAPFSNGRRWGTAEREETQRPARTCAARRALAMDPQVVRDDQGGEYPASHADHPSQDLGRVGR